MSKLAQSHWWSALFILFFPLLIMYGYSEFIRSSELNARLGWLILIGGLAYLFRHTWLQRLLLGVMFLFAVSGSLDILYAVTFSGVFTSASFDAMAQTDLHEGWEFLIAYASFENVSILLVYWLIAYFSLKKILFRAATRRREKVLLGLGIIMVFVAVQQINQRGRTFDTIPGFTGVAIDYVQNQEGLDKAIERRKNLYMNKPFTASKSSEQPQTYIVVVGESLNRNHMAVYGYGRDTTPRLMEYKEDMIAFDDVISPFAQTRPSLSVTLTEADLSNRLPEPKAISLIGAFKKAGYTTWWISNQQPLRRPTTAISRIADHAHFISHDFHGVEVRRYDGHLIAPVKKALQHDAKHKVIFVHMMGSHLQYQNRFPEDQRLFSGKEGIQAYSDELSDSALTYINDYDSSVRYTDSVVGEMLDMLAQQPGPAALTFFADHGEEVFDNRNFKGHGPDGLTKDMLEVPFIFWRNAEHRSAFAVQNQQMMQNRNQPAMLDDFFHFALCSAGVMSSLYQAENSLCSADYQPQKRVVYGKNYDKGLK